MNKEGIRDSLIEDLFKKKVFWSYHAPYPDQISDEVLIEKVLVHEDLDNIYRLFDVFPEKKIKNVWKERLVPDVRNTSINRLYALILFHIKDPDRYIHRLAG